MRTRILFLFTSLFVSLLTMAQAVPSASPTMTFTDNDGATQTETNFSGNAPFTATFAAHPENVGNYTPRYEWRITKSPATEPFLIRYDEQTSYTFTESGDYTIRLLISFLNGTERIDWEMDQDFTVSISESRLEFPNAFTPNGDGVNDIFQAKEGFQSIIEFHAQVFSRSGKKIHEWKNPAEGWDGKVNGNPAPDGGYYLLVKAKGADGRVYHIKKVINLLRKYIEGTRP